MSRLAPRCERPDKEHSMTNATYTHTPYRPGVVRLRAGRLIALIILVMALIIGGGLWFLHTYGKRVTPPSVDTSATNPAWMKQGIHYPPDKVTSPETMAAAPDRSAEILRQLAALQQELQQQRDAIEALKRRPSTVINQQAAQSAKAASIPQRQPPGAMLFISHDVKEPPPAPLQAEYTLAPGATKLPCVLESVINSDVEDGYFTCRITTNVYDTATGQHLLVPQGSTVLGNNQSSELLYGRERLDTISLTLTLPDGRSVDLGRAPVTDHQGVPGLTGDVNQHYWRLFGAVFIGGVLKGGMLALNTAVTQAAGAGQVASGIASVGNQATNRLIGRALDTRPTITVHSGQLCNILLIKPLSLPAMWQGTTPITTTAATQPAAPGR
jgi:type IV secretory pathway VirB10-like protein